MTKVDKKIKVERMERKAVLKNTVGRRLPQELLKAPKKGFRVPVGEWMKQERFRDLLDEYDKYADMLNTADLRLIYEDNLRGKYDAGNLLWSLFVLIGVLEYQV
jgi:asparagine synthase (glutamine-hydrolysing)